MRQSSIVGILLYSALFIFLYFPLHGQNTWVRDSIHFDKGVEASVDFEKDLRVFFPEHDAEGRPLISISRKKNAQGAWEFWRRRQYTYTGNVLTQVHFQYWNEDLQEWQDASEKNYEFNSDGQLLQRHNLKAPDPGQDLENHQLWSYTYGSEGELLEMVKQNWDDGAWKNSARQIWAYHPNGLIQSQLVQFWVGTLWVNARQRMWEYEPGTELLKTVTSQSWNLINQEWENLARQLYANDGQFQWTGVVRQTWNPNDEAWINLERELMSYNNGVFQGRELQYWQNGQWVPRYRGSYTFDGNTINSLFDEWDPNEAIWQMAFRFQSVYEDQSRLLLDQGWQLWNADMEQWENDSDTQRNTHFWRELVSKTEDLIFKPLICPIPNPYAIGTAIECQELQAGQVYSLTLTDLSGKMIVQKRVEGGRLFSIDQALPSGLYILSLSQPQGLVHLQKLVIF